ncbi:hypothetical protein ANN_22877 [Periplaneta americana]|uniref:C-type lectin domain-containing protein n=1 Tax=Periplaneta americana TaxID=6978 RepID=A0ABQ8SJJ1_PERAM|nr:hypothetical protein ANN_22877 [Periplaneta americana]
MLRRATVCCVLWCAVACAELQCALPHTSALKFSITSLRNETGHWIAQLQLGHTAEEKNRGPWELDVDHSTAKCEDSESILIAAKITAPPTAQISVPLLRGVPTAPGYELVPLLGYYKLHSSVNTWHGALKICEDEGAHLMVINSEAEVQALKPLWEKTPPAKITGGSHNDWAWVGFHDLYKEGEFVTIFSKCAYQLIPDLPRKSSVAAFRLATGHDCLAKHLHRIGIYQSPNCPLCNSNQEMDSEHLKICASVADHDNIFEKYWSARGQMILLSNAWH